MFSVLMQALIFWSVLLPGAEVPLEGQRGLLVAERERGAVRVDLYRPTNRVGPHPVIVLVHGGAWFVGTSNDYQDFVHHFAIAGYATASVDFRLIPEDGFYGQVQDIKDTIRWLRLHARDYNLDPERIGLFGSSSGGHLAGLVAATTNDEGLGIDPPGTSSAVDAAFLLYGVYDLTTWIPNPIVRAYTGGLRFEDAPLVYQAYSPLFHIDGSEPPTAVMHGTRDWAVDFQMAEDYVAAMQAAGVAAELLPFEGGGHGFGKLRPWTRPAIFDALLTFFARELGPPTGLSTTAN